MYEDTNPNLQTKFEQYLFKERSWRYDLYEWQENTNNRISKLLDGKHEAAYGRFFTPTFSTTNSQDVTKCSEGISKLDSVPDALTEKTEEVKMVRATLFEGHTLKKWMTEKDHYLQMKITATESMLENCRTSKEAMGNTYTRLQKVTKGLLPWKMDHMKKRRKRKNISKVVVRKMKKAGI